MNIGTLLSYVDASYERYAQTCDDVTHAQCWSYSRRYFDRALKAESVAVEEALMLIGVLYRHEEKYWLANRSWPTEQNTANRLSAHFGNGAINKHNERI